MPLLRRTALTASLLLLLAGCSAGSEPPDLAAAKQIQGLVTYPYVAPNHAAKPQTYPQAPPVGGDHWPPSAEGVTGWLTCGVYTQILPNEFAVHSMEHGAVWLTYRPGTSAAQVATLAALAGRNPGYVLVSPYRGQTGAFGATTWGAQLFVDRPDDPRLTQFIELYAGGGQGREKGAPCTGGSTPEQADAALAKVR